MALCRDCAYHPVASPFISLLLHSRKFSLYTLYTGCACAKIITIMTIQGYCKRRVPPRAI